MKSRLVLGFAFVGLSAVGLGYWMGRASASGAPATASLTYSGFLTDGTGAPLTGTKSMQLQVFDAATAGNMKCSIGPKPIALGPGGAFVIALPDDCATAARQSPDLWIEAFVAGDSLGRAKLGAVPYALEADHAQTATTAATANALAAGPVAGALTLFQVAGSALAAPCAVSGTSSTVDCTCPAGSFVVSGGGWGAVGTYLRESRPTATNTWRVTCGTGSADALCNGYTLVCSRIGP